MVWIREKNIAAPVRKITTIDGEVLYLVEGEHYYPEELKEV